MRSSLARVAAVGSALTLAACAVIAGLEDPQTVSDATSGEGGSTSGSTSGSLQDTGSSSSGGGSSGGSSSGADATSSDATADAQPDAPTCSLLKNGDTCQGGSQCCSGKCNENRQCANDCDTAGQFKCAPGSTSECCVGLWCNVESCVPCIASGQPAAQPAGFPYGPSCCSRSANLISGNCL